ncbi:hypothetical protein EDD36DRAFT_121843 [Exophiala viscosa]|uniref:Protein MON2 homolog n=1 Tax=Exophiala viscosa TaxID=2486360 RepID=A0AAN6E0S3_9EURO|nr:hypothetical protein EDD36DRAFT_121843 [Exophiala viscosa]
MTHAFLQSELTSLISESKRRYNDVRTAAEQSLSDLKAISVTSESQLAGDLLRRPQFIDPFVLACKSKNAKLAISGTSCLQRLTASKAIARARLRELLDALHDAVASGYEPQLKILQTLPSLLQLYGSDLHDDLLAKALETCAALQSSKAAIVSNTAAATFQQLASTVFDQASKGESTRLSSDSNSKSDERDNETPKVFSDDATRLFNDFCLLLDQQQAQFLKLESLPSALLLETLQMIFSNHASFVASQLDLLHDELEHLVQGLLRILARRDAFGEVVRALSIVFLILQNFANDLRTHLQPLLSLVVEGLEKEGNPLWKRTLCLEFFRNICSDFGVFRSTFELFDSVKEENDKVIGQFMSALVRIAAEDPSLIGLGRQSTVPVQRTNDAKSEEAASIEAQGLAGAITSVSTGDSNTTGISMEWSLPSSPLMDQPEKHNPPAIPSTYIYSLVLGCIASFCEGISKFVMPLSVPSRSAQREATENAQGDGSGTDPVGNGVNGSSNRSTIPTNKYHRLINPLTLTHHPGFPQIQTCAAMIEACWPAALATCSTFLNSALDAEFYHILIRSVQKLAQVSGVLELSTPRDALLTTLAKASVPNNASSIISNSQHTRTPRIGGPENDDLHDEVKPATEAPPTPTFQVTTSPLNVRHLLCLRALLNLGIALGPTLEQDAWFIIIETMQTVEALTALPTVAPATAQTASPRIGVPGSEGQATLAGEIASVQAATKRMLESTRTYNREAFSIVVQALFRLLGDTGSDTDSPSTEELITSPISPGRPGPRSPYRTSRTISALWTNFKTFDLEIGFVLGKISEISRINITRFASLSEQPCSWDLIGRRLLRILQDSGFSGPHRIHSASILDLVAMETMKLLDNPQLDAKEANTVRFRCLHSLLEQLQSLEQTTLNKIDTVGLEIHKRLLEALETILSDSGDSLDSAWSTPLTILSMTFLKRGQASLTSDTASVDHDESDEHNGQILRVAFRSIQLITSDFLGALTKRSLFSLARLLRQFGSQSYDLNVALTSTTLLWSLTSHILTSIENIELREIPASDTELKDDSPNPTSDTLWSITLLQLVALCKDERSDVRNAATRVLLKMLDASSESLDPNAWSVTLKIGPSSAIRYCVQQCLSHEEDAEWLASAAQLTDGTVQLICQNLAVIVKHEAFKDTWLRILDIFEDLLSLSSLSASALAFTSISRLLTSLQTLEKDKSDLLAPVLQLWASNHPAEILQSIHPGERRGEVESVPNQPAVTAHIQTIIEADKTSAEAVANFQLDEREMVSLLMDSIEKTVLLSTHPAYTSDVKSLAPEQQEACSALLILKRLLGGDTAQYSRYLLRLVKLSLSIQAGKVGTQTKKSAIHKAVQKPTFIAFASACLGSLKGLVLEHVDDANLIHTLALQESFETLSALIKTKYTDLPTNNQAPLWRSATVTAVVTLEAVQKRVKQNSSAGSLSELGNLSGAVITVASSVLQPGGLANPPLKHGEDTLLDDENFDIDHFRLFHAAVVAVFQHDGIDSACRQYAITLFKASLLSKPWFHDLPDNLSAEPLKDLLKVRPGSLHQPVFAVRRRTCYAAMDALFELVQRHPEQDGSESGSDELARAACPYLLLRVVHPLKTFLADQRLRGLTPPPMPQQVELQTVLTKFVQLRSNTRALRDLTGGRGADDKGDGKQHLRILYSFILRVQKFWRELPRLKAEGAWQADEPGRGIEQALDQWSMDIAQTWSADLSA